MRARDARGEGDWARIIGAVAHLEGLAVVPLAEGFGAHECGLDMTSGEKRHFATAVAVKHAEKPSTRPV